MSFWDVVWFILISFAFVAYLMVVFSIITDLFRDETTSGFAKAVWFIALIFVPFVTACVYLIAKGGKMAERSVRSQERMMTQQEAYIREVAGKATPADQIAQAKAMYEAGDLTEAEYTKLKEKALA